MYVHIHPRGAICMLVLVLKPTGDFRSHSFYTHYENSTRIPPSYFPPTLPHRTRTHASSIAVPSIGNDFSRN